MTILQQPDAYSLTSMVKDFIISSSTSITFQVLNKSESILLESYVPDSDDRIVISDLGKLFESYLTGLMDVGNQDSISSVFNFKINSSTAGSTTALLCRAYTAQDAVDFFTGKNPLNLQYGKKVTIPTAREYLSFYLLPEDVVQVKVLCRSGEVVSETEWIPFHSVLVAAFHTLEVSPRRIVNLIPTIDPYSIIGYYVGVGDIYTLFTMDWSAYLDPKIFRYLNSFGVPETLVTRGEVVRKRVLNFESSKINHIEKRFNLRRADTFEVSTGKIFSQMDAVMVSEMIASEFVQVYFCGSLREIVITEEDSTENQRRGALSSSSFIFRFADEKLNLMLNDPTWAMLDGSWNDQGNWLDDGEWTDKPYEDSTSGSGSDSYGL